MSDEPVDYYEVLQISPNAEPDTIHRIYRLLAQRFHPDNAVTGNDAQFRAVSEAYQVLTDPERRARYDVAYEGRRKDRWRLVSSGTEPENDFDFEQQVRLTVLEVLYTRRRTEPDNPGVTPLDLEVLIGRAREQLEFTIWYLIQKKWVTRNDNSALLITAEGADFLESHYKEQRKRQALPGSTSADASSERRASSRFGISKP
jgi:curved DNA-binding protein CbpA